MKNLKILCIGDNVCDKYLSRGKMYPGGQCVNTAVYAKMNGVDSAYMGIFGDDEVGQYVQDTLKSREIDFSHSRFYPGENGFACVTLNGNDRVFIGSNKGGVAKEHPYAFNKDDFNYIKEFSLIYTNLNAYIENDIESIANLNVPICFDFSNRWTDKYLDKIAPYITMATLSCAHLSNEERQNEMKKVSSYGVKYVIGTVGEDGAWVLYKNVFYYYPAILADNVKDTMGAGDSYFASFMSYILKNSNDSIEDVDPEILKKAMLEAAQFSSNICCLEGAFGCGTVIKGRIIDNRNNIKI